MPAIIQHQRQLTDTEIATAAREMSSIHSDVEDLEAQLKLASTSFKQQIKAKREEIHQLVKKIRLGYEEVPVACDIHFNLPTPGMKVYWDPTTLTIIRREAMTDKDRQLYLFESRPTPQELLDVIEKELPPATEG